MAAAILTIVLVLFICSFATPQNVTKSKAEEFHVGVILDLGTLVGKVTRTSISLAMEDFYAVHPNYSTRVVLHFRDSMGDDFQAASAVLNLLENYNVQAIIGPQKSSQAVFVSILGNRSQVPVISFTATSPNLPYCNLPYFVHATLNESAHVNSIAAIIKAYGWREVVPIYVNSDYGTGLMSDLIDTLQRIDIHVPYRSMINQAATNEQITIELYKLMTMQTTVFIVHMPPSLGSLLFTTAKEIGMMSKGFAWIMTHELTSLIDSLNPSAVEAMNGALGIQSYVPKTRELDDFTMRWNMRSRADNPNDPALTLNIFGLWGYDTIWAVARATENAKMTKAIFQRPPSKKNSTSMETLETLANGPALLKEILQNKFRGLSGHFDISNGHLKGSAFQIINVVGKGKREIGFWTEQSGLSQQFHHTRSETSPSSTAGLNFVFWPGESTNVPRGWKIPVIGKKLKVGVVTGGGYPEYIDAKTDPITNVTKATGLAIDVFEEAVKRLPYALPYEYTLFNITKNVSLSYDDFVHQVYLGLYDIAVGDILIRYDRTLHVDFTMPYSESGIAMVVPVKESIKKSPWIFLKPLTPSMWFGTIILFIYTGIVIWMLEFLGNNKNARGPIPRQLAVMIYFPLFEGKENVKRLISRIVLVTWLFFLVVLKSSYTASLTSMLTVEQLEPTVTNVLDLIKKGEYVGYDSGSYVKGLLEELGFEKSKIKPYDPEEYHNALSRGSKNGGIAAFVDEIPFIKLFLAKHCKGYTMVGPIYKSAGFGFAFPKGSPLLGDISQAILNITEGDTIIKIEKKWIGDQNVCHNLGTVTGSDSLTLASFMGPIILTGVASTSSILVALIIFFYKKKQEKYQNCYLERNLSREENKESTDEQHQSQ